MLLSAPFVKKFNPLPVLNGKHVLDAQGLFFFEQGNQAVDVRMLARIFARILGVFGVDFQPLLRRLGCNRAIGLRQMVVDGE